ncbi:hypothetical protein [uncultured Nostoc sp.]|uniref:hypothetical protein n=1 Tax=uncultured Nostoc sp. TaxID=340711 RepID=UPI0035CA57C0
MGTANPAIATTYGLMQLAIIGCQFPLAGLWITSMVAGCYLCLVWGGCFLVSSLSTSRSFNASIAVGCYLHWLHSE